MIDLLHVNSLVVLTTHASIATYGLPYTPSAIPLAMYEPLTRGNRPACQWLLVLAAVQRIYAHFITTVAWPKVPVPPSPIVRATKKEYIYIYIIFLYIYRERERETSWLRMRPSSSLYLEHEKGEKQKPKNCTRNPSCRAYTPLSTWFLGVSVYMSLHILLFYSAF